MAGQALMMFVPQQTWITANFKETQLDRMRPNQPAEIIRRLSGLWLCGSCGQHPARMAVPPDAQLRA